MFSMNEWTNDAQSNLISLLVLETINKKDSYGYEIKKSIESLIKENKFEFEFKLSSLYTLLRRLENKNCIVSFKDLESANNERDKTRTFYKITTKGKNDLINAWKEWENLFSLFQSISNQFEVIKNVSQ